MLSVNQYVEVSKKITALDVERYAKLTGDYNPIHFDDNFAANTIFKKRIAHGPYVLTLITTLFANELPGPGTVYLSHNVRFIKPVYIDDEITARVTIKEILPNNHIITETVCTNQNGETVIEGEARLKKL